jgi:beta-lactam-binding protein with PASTA domain
MSVKDARRITRLSELHLAVDEHPSDDALRGGVLAQHPEPGSSVEPGAMISVDVGSRPLTTVPDVRGRDEEGSLEALRQAGLAPGRRTLRRSDSVPADHVIRTRPRSGASVPLGTRVSIVVSAPARPRGGISRGGGKRVRAQRFPDETFMTLPGDE